MGDAALIATQHAPRDTPGFACAANAGGPGGAPAYITGSLKCAAASTSGTAIGSTAAPAATQRCWPKATAGHGWWQWW